MNYAEMFYVGVILTLMAAGAAMAAGSILTIEANVGFYAFTGSGFLAGDMIGRLLAAALFGAVLFVVTLAVDHIVGELW